MDRHHHRLTGGIDRWKGAPGRGDRLGDALQAQGEFGDDAQRALGPDQQAGQVIPGRGFLGPMSGADDLPVRHHRLKAEDVVLHGAIAHRIGARGPRCRHPAQRGIGAGVDGKEQALIAQMGVQVLARHTGLHDAIQIARMDRQNLVHLVRSTEIPPAGAFTCPSSDVPVPKGITGTLCWAQVLTISDTSSVERAETPPRPETGFRSRWSCGRAVRGSPDPFAGDRRTSASECRQPFQSRPRFGATSAACTM